MGGLAGVRATLHQRSDIVHDRYDDDANDHSGRSVPEVSVRQVQRRTSSWEV